ncbi:MAG: ROK family transcriptional regulator [Alphaproteobacteria bacterium]|nr:ROK family transcriptional regulator [Alphaproteobacteria bacterium]
MNENLRIGAKIPNAGAPKIATDSERLILDIVRRNSEITRSSLTRHTHITQQSVHRLVDGLIARDLLMTGQPIITGPGKPSPRLSLNPDALYSIGVSINTDTISLSIANLACAEVAATIVDSDPADRVQSLQDMATAIKALVADNGIPLERIIGVGVAMSGYRSNGHDCYVCPPPISEWSDLFLTPLFEAAFGLPVWTENNATSGAIGESLIGAGRLHSTFAYLSFNFGFGGGMIVDGKPLLGGFGNAGEISVTYTEAQVESRPALGELIKRLAKHGIHISSLPELSASFDPNWPGLKEWIEEVTPNLYLAVRAIRAMVDPTAIVFGGEAPEYLRKMLITACQEMDQRNQKRRMPPEPQLLCSSMQGDPSTYGAALVPLKACVLM